MRLKTENRAFRKRLQRIPSRRGRRYMWLKMTGDGRLSRRHCELHIGPRPNWESAIHGAAAIARHPELTRLLLEYGADPNDEERPYHVPERFDKR